MAILKKEDQPIRKREIDLTGPDGNVFFLIGVAIRWGKQMGLDTDVLTNDMMSGDYDNAVAIFDKNFGSICDLIR